MSGTTGLWIIGGILAGVAAGAWVALEAVYRWIAEDDKGDEKRGGSR